MNVQERIAAAKAEIETAKPSEVRVELGGEITKLGFLPLDGPSWANLTAKHSPRKGSALDAELRYNLDAVVADYPPSHVRIDGGPATAAGTGENGEAIVVNVYAEVAEVLASPYIKLIGEVLFTMHQMAPAIRIQQLGKASAGAPKKTPRSRAK
jgi:hypothetical protein